MDYGRSEKQPFCPQPQVGSILWIISGHVMAIQSRSGPGYLNPRQFLPPTGITTTLMGQLLFSSRFAVDTFLCISGYLVVVVLRRRLHHQPRPAEICYVLFFRLVRILPLYCMCLGFWMFVAPHLGSGYVFDAIMAIQILPSLTMCTILCLVLSGTSGKTSWNHVGVLGGPTYCL